MWHAWGGGEVFTGFWSGRLRRGWEDNIKLYLREIGIEGANWRAFVNTIMNLRVP
jgi:hypothetical protein